MPIMPEVDEATLLAAESVVLSRCLWRFVRHAWPLIEDRPYIEAWHLRVLCDHLERLPEWRNLAVNMPPACGKSLVTSVLWPCWVWTTQPATRWIFASYADHLATRFSLLRRRVLDSPWFQERWPGIVKFSADQNAKTEWQNTAGGYMASTSVRGQLTGTHPDHFVADDPNDVRKMESHAEREAVNSWWDGLVMSRGMSRDVNRVILQQRTAMEDLTGHVLAKDPDGWCRLVLPMRAEPDAVKPTRGGWRDERAEGELLCPELIGEAAVRSLELSLGPQRAAGQLQQRPVQAGGAMFREETFRYFRAEHVAVGDVTRAQFVLSDEAGERRVWQDECWWCQTVDTAMKEGLVNDYTVVLTACVTPLPACLLLVWVRRERLPVPRQFGMLMDERARFPLVRVQAVEDAASGIGLIQEGRLRGVPFRPMKVGRSKIERATAVLTAYEGGLVYHHAGQSWLAEFEDELVTFPAGEHDDQVDGVAMAGVLFQERCFSAIRGVDEIVCYPERSEVEREKDRTATEAEGLTLAEQLTGRRPSRTIRERKFDW